MTQAQKIHYETLSLKREVLIYKVQDAQRKHNRTAHLQEQLRNTTHTMLAMEVYDAR